MKLHKEEVFEQYIKTTDSFHNIYADKKFQVVFEMYIIEIVVDFFIQLKATSSFDQAKDHYVPDEIKTNEERLEVSYWRKCVKHKWKIVLSIAVIKTFNRWKL